MKNKKTLIIITGIIVLCITSIAFTLISNSNSSFLPKNNDLPDTANKTVELGYFSQLQGTDIFIARISEDGNQRSISAGRWFGYNFGDGAIAHNLLFLNTTTLESNLLLETNDYTFVDVVIYPEPVYTPPSEECEEEEIITVETLIYKIAKDDTNSDKKITYEDLLTISVSGVSGKNYTELLTNIEHLYEMKIEDNGIAIVIYKEEDEDKVSLIDLKSLTIKQTKLLENWSLSEK